MTNIPGARFPASAGPIRILRAPQYNRKASFAFGGYGLTHELLASGGRKLAAEITQKTPEGDSWRRRGQYISADPADAPDNYRYLVLNTLGWERRVRYPLPSDMGGAAPHGVLEMFLIGNYREAPPLIVRVPGADLDRSGNFLRCDPQGQCEIQIKRAADEVIQRVAFPVAVVAAAWRCTPAEVNQEPLDVRDNAISLPVPSRSVACARVAFQ